MWKDTHPTLRFEKRRNERNLKKKTTKTSVSFACLNANMLIFKYFKILKQIIELKKS